MMGRITVLLLALFIAHPALSEPVRIRSGEHKNFTRIVFDLPKRVKWELREKEGKTVLTFTGQELEFDTSTVFNRLSDGRLSAISSGPGIDSLTIELGCECELATFWYGGSSLVVDIRDVDETAQEDPVIQATESANRPSPIPVSEIERRRASSAPIILPEINSSIAAALTIAEFSSDLPAAAVEPTEPSEINISDPVTAQVPVRDMHKTREALLRQIGRAASQGLLSPSMALPGKSAQQNGQDHTVTDDNSDTSPMLAEAEVSPETTDHINLRAQSSIDRDFLGALAQASGEAADATCIKPKQIDVATWGTDEPFAEQIGAVRIRLSGEFDKTDEAVALELTRLYLYFGFGVEALQTLKLTANETRETALLKDLATIFKHGYAPAGSQLAGQLNCDAPISLWSALSYQTLPTDVPMNDNSILRGFNALPPHLRSYLGPILSRRFLEAGHQTISDRLLRILNRSEETTTPDADLVKAEIVIAEGAHVVAGEILDDVVTSGAKPSAEALLLKIETALEADQEISFETAQLAGAYAQENRDEALGRELSQAYVVSLAASGAFDQSYQEFTRLKSQLQPETQHIAQSRILGFLAANADDMTFLEHVFTDHADQLDNMNAQVINTVAKRLLALGFTDKARTFLIPPAAGEQGRTRALLRAEASLLDNRPRQAEVDLLGLTGVDVNQLRAKARSQVGEHMAAAQLFSAGNQPDMAKREAWLAEDWDMVLAANDPVLTDVAMLVKPDIPPDAAAPLAGDAGVLAQGRALIEASSSTRSTIESLLLSQPGPAAQN
jgi:hypothetical protein